MIACGFVELNRKYNLRRLYSPRVDCDTIRRVYAFGLGTRSLHDDDDDERTNELLLISQNTRMMLGKRSFILSLVYLTHCRLHGGASV